MFEVMGDFTGGFFEGAIETESLGVRRTDAIISTVPFRRRIQDPGGALHDSDVSFRNRRSGARIVGLGMETDSR